MDIVRKLAIAIVMIIPAFVFSGLVWHWFESWWPVLAVVMIAVILYFFIITRKLSRNPQEA